MNTHDIDIELPEHDCLYETTNESGFIDVEPAYRKSTVLRLIEADRKRRGISNDCEPVGDMSQGCDVPLADPQQVVPLTDERIRLIWEETRARMGVGGDPVLWVARAIERAHGISTPQPAEPVNNKASNRKELLLSWVLLQCGARRYEGGAYFDNFSLSRLRYIIGELDEKATQPAEPDRGEPVGYINPEHIGQGHGSGIFWKADQNFSTPVYVLPQPAEHTTQACNMQSTEPVKRKRPYAQGTALGEFGVIPMCDQVDDEPVKFHPEVGKNAKKRFESAMKGSKETDPIERLRFYCSLAMSGQDWLDAEPFFDALVADRRRSGEPVAWTTPDEREPISAQLKESRFDLYNKHYTVPLYTTPQAPDSVSKTDWNNELSSWSDEDFIRISHECPDLANRLRKILAEPVKVSNMTTKIDTERERAEFEAWFEDERGQPARKADGTYSPFASGCWRAWQAAQAALQSQYLEDAERLEWLVENMCRVDIDEGHRGWFVLERDTTNYLVEDCKTFREAIDHARHIEGGNHE